MPVTARQHLADSHVLAVFDGDDRSQLESDVDRQLRSGQLHFVAALVQQFHLRPDTLRRCACAALRVDNHQRGQAGNFVDLLGHRDAFFDVFEFHPARVFGDDGPRRRVPRRQHLARLHRVAVLDQHSGAIGNLMPFALAAVVVMNHDFAGARNHDQLALAVGDIAHRRREANDAGGLAFQLRRRGGTRCRTSDVEGPHRELGAWLADRLRRNDPDRLAHVDQVPAAQIAAVAGRAQAIARVAGERSAHLDLVDSQRLDLLDFVFAEQGAGVEQRRLRFGIDDVRGDGATEDPLAQRLDDFAAFDQRLHRHAVTGAAIVLGDH